MTLMSEKRAWEIFDQYMKAEMAGNDAQAKELESQLNNANWIITGSDKGMTIVKGDRGWFSSGINSDYTPQEKDYTGYKPDNDSPNRGIWLAIGITAGVVALILLSVYLFKKYKRNANAKLNVATK